MGRISVIIPTYNEENFIQETVIGITELSSSYLREIIVVDGGSSDRTVEQAGASGAKVVKAPKKGRAVQMNYGASLAGGDILYFIHADSRPPDSFDTDILNEINRGNPAGCFRLEFDSDHPLLNFYSWCTHFDINAFRFGDQSLYITRDLFRELDGFKEDHIVMEDNEMVVRIKREYPFKIIPKPVTTSARKYHENGKIRLQLVYALIYTLYQFKLPQKKLKSIYKNLIK